jgi:hypothetical protein
VVVSGRGVGQGAAQSTVELSVSTRPSEVLSVASRMYLAIIKLQ